MTELLAPVGSFEALVAAVENGAQAVYLGGKLFGARHYAPNFDDEELAAGVRYAHLRNVLVYVTVNTLVDTEELPDLASYLRRLYTIGVDAIIVQDIAVAQIARKVVPGLHLHGSTQMTIHNLAGVEYLAALGFHRVVLARELSLEDIRYICKHSSVEIEVFIHGALCICYSGQCLMSSLIGGRSANRGKCAQPCRLPYELVDSEGQNVLAGKDTGEYLLSPKDLNTLEILPDLVQAGIASFKIEGRMKRPEYVAVVVDSYRRALDSVLNSGQTGVDAAMQKAVAQVFNRAFTTAYLQGKPERAMMSDRRPNNRGSKLGRVLAYDGVNKGALIQLDEELAVGDVIEVWVKVGGRVNITVTDLFVDGNRVEMAPAGVPATVNVPSLVRASDRVFKTFDARLMAKARASFVRQESLKRIGVYGAVTGKLGEPLTITLTDEAGYEGVAQTNFICEQARNRPLTAEIVHKQIERLGTTGFSLLELSCQLDGELMVPVSEINDARRRAVVALEEARLARFSRPPLPAAIAVKSLFLPALPAQAIKPQLVVNVDRVDKVQAALQAGADIILLGGECYGHKGLNADDYQQATQLVRKANRQIIFNTPRLVKEWQVPAFIAELKLFQDLQPDVVAVGNVGTLYLLKQHTSLPFQGDYPLNTFNKLSLDFLAAQGAVAVTLSPELNFGQIERLAAIKSVPIECLVHGHMTMMVSEYCVTGGYLGAGGLAGKECRQACFQGKYYLKDRLNALFPVVTDQYCRMHILNSKELSMIPHVPKFAEAGVDRLRIEAKYMDTATVSKITRFYRELIDQGNNHPALLSGQVEALEGTEITRGHYFRGVL